MTGNGATMSFRQAFRAKESGAISWDEYIRTMFARFTGAGHSEDDRKDWYYEELRGEDPFGYTIWLWSRRAGNLTDAKPYEEVFLAYRKGTLDDVKHKLAPLQMSSAEEAKTSLALLALQERRPDVMKYCLEHGADLYEGIFRREANKVDEKTDPDTFRALENSEFRRLFPRYVAKKHEGKVGARPGAESVFDAGGKYPVKW